MKRRKFFQVASLSVAGAGMSLAQSCTGNESTGAGTGKSGEAVTHKTPDYRRAV